MDLHAASGASMDPPAEARATRTERAALVGILLLAAWLRLWGLGRERLYGDEAEYALVAGSLSHAWDALLYPPLEGIAAGPFVSQPPLALYLMAATMRILGPTDLAAILPSALLGVATVLAVYALMRRLASRRAALAAAALLAVLPFHVEMSRSAMLDAPFVFFVVLTLHAMVAWSRTGRARWALASGASAGLALMTKLPGIVVCAFVALAFLAVAAFRRDARFLAHAPLMAAPAVGGRLRRR